MNVGRYIRGEDRHVGTDRTTNTKDIQMNERKLIKVKINTISEHDMFAGYIDDIIKYVTDIKQIYTDDGFQDLEIELNPYGYDGAYHIELYGKRFENTRELGDRLKKEQREAEMRKKTEDKKQAEELKLYKKLQRKYGKIQP